MAQALAAVAGRTGPLVRCHPASAPTVVLAAALALIAPDRSLAQGPKAVSSFELSPGIVIDPSRREAYVMRPEGGIAAVDLARGAELWRSQQAAKPLAVSGNLLVGQAEAPGPGNALRIVALNTGARGALVRESFVPLPPNVHPMIGPAANRSFTAEAKPHAGEAVVSWEFVERPFRGLSPGPAQVLPGEAPPGVSPMVPSLGMPGASAMAPGIATEGPEASQPCSRRRADRPCIRGGHIGCIATPGARSCGRLGQVFRPDLGCGAGYRLARRPGAAVSLR